MSYFHCSNGYPDRCNGYRGPLDEYVCLNPRHDAERVEARTPYPCYCLPGPARCDEPYSHCDRPMLAARRGTAETGDDDE